MTFRSMAGWLRTVFGRARFEAEMAEEMRLHIEARAADLLRRGVTPAQATRLARMEFGSTERYKEEGRESRGLRLVDQTRSDLRVTWRSLRKSPVFTAAAIVTLTVGIGANAAVFSIIRGVLLKPLPYSHPERIYSARTVFPPDLNSLSDSPVSGPLFARWRRACTSCEGMALLYVGAVNLGIDGGFQRVDAISASSRLFPLLGTQMQLGRAFTDAEDQPGAGQVVVISDALWRGSFAADPGILGRKVIWNRTPVEIVGVLPPSFRFPRGEQAGAMIRMPDRVDIFRPIGTDPARLPGVFNFGAFVKLRANTTMEQATTEMNRPPAEGNLRAADSGRVRLLPLKEKMIGETRRPLWMLSLAAAALLLIVCVNLGNLLLVRAVGHQRDWVIRSAIGASRMDLIRQALTESLTLASAGGLLGIGAAAAGIKLLPRLAASTLPRLDEVALDWQVLLLTLVLSTATGALCSLASVWRLLRTDPQHVLGASSLRATETPGARRARHALVACEAGLSMALAAAAGLLIVSFVRVMAADKGFNPEGIVTFQLSLEGQYAADRRALFHGELLDKLRSLPAVVSAGLISQLPLQGESWVSELARPSDSPGAAPRTQANYRFISPAYFQAAGTPLRSGHPFTDADRTQAVAILSESAARSVFPGENPLGQTIRFGADGGPRILEIVGIAADVKTTGLEAAPPPTVYLPFWRIALGGASYVVRASAIDAGLVPAIRAAAASVAPDVPIHHVRTMSEIVDASVASRRLQTWLAGAFATAGVLLTCLGVFGVVSFGVSRRTPEIGVRMALGATQAEVVLMVIRESLRPVLIGVACGAATALALGPYLASLLYGVRPHDPWVLGAIGALICTAAAVAAYWPARRAARIHPMQALRWE